MSENMIVTLASMLCATVILVTFIHVFFSPSKNGTSQFADWGERAQKREQARFAMELERERMMRGVYVIQSSNGVHIVPAAGTVPDADKAPDAPPSTSTSSL